MVTLRGNQVPEAVTFVYMPFRFQRVCAEAHKVLEVSRACGGMVSGGCSYVSGEHRIVEGNSEQCM